MEIEVKMFRMKVSVYEERGKLSSGLRKTESCADDGDYRESVDRKCQLFVADIF